MCQPCVTLDPRIAKRSVLIATEGEDCLIHMLSVEDLSAYKQVKILHSEAGNGQEEVRLQFRYHILQSVLAKVGQVHENRDAGSKLD